MARKLDFTISDLSKFMGREASNEKSSIQRIIEGEPEEAIITGDVLGPLKSHAPEDRYYVLRAEKVYFSRFRPGDSVELATICSKTKKFKKLKDSSIKMVRFPEPGVIEVLIPGDGLPMNHEMEVFILPKSFSGIKWVLRQRLQDIDRAGFASKHFPINRQAVKQKFSQVAEKLNTTQNEALRFLIDNDFQGLVQGPPGTGKTHLLVDLVRLAVESNIRVGLVSLTHAAVDNALGRILQSGLDPSQVVRIASEKAKVKTDHYKDLSIDEIWSGSFKSFTTKIEYDDGGIEPHVYAATLHTWCLTKKTPEVDVLIIDEASQVPIYFYPFLKVLSSRVILFGDHKQLPPVIQVTNHNLPAEDIFSYEIEQGTYPMLEIQYRMNEGVQEWSSNRFYQGRLHPDESNRNRDVIFGLDAISGRIGSKVVNMVSHSGPSHHNANKIEASKVADLVWALKTERSLPLEAIGIVTPHRAQAGAICAQLQAKLGLAEMQKVLVDTVERFQGQEREAMILSMGAEKDNSLKGDKGFLGDGRRLNVAVTRARSRFYCFASEKLIENTKRQKNSEHLNSFFEWCSKSDQRKRKENAS